MVTTPVNSHRRSISSKMTTTSIRVGTQPNMPSTPAPATTSAATSAAKPVPSTGLLKSRSTTTSDKTALKKKTSLIKPRSTTEKGIMDLPPSSALKVNVNLNILYYTTESRASLETNPPTRAMSATKSMPTQQFKKDQKSYAAKRALMVSPSSRPDFSHVKSKIGSLENIKHKPSGGTSKVYDENVDELRSRIASKVGSKIGSLDNIKHKPGGGSVTIYDDRANFIKSKDISSKVGSLDNIKHKPGGGFVTIYDDKFEFIKSKEITSKVGSLDNIKHKPGGGDVKIYDDKSDYIKSKEITSKVGSLDNIKHKAGGGDLKIYDEKFDFIRSKEITSKVGSLDNIKHKPGGGDVEIYNDRSLSFIKDKPISSKVGSLDNIKHKPKGGDLLVYNQRLSFKSTANSRIDVGTKRRIKSSLLTSPTSTGTTSPSSVPDDDDFIIALSISTD
ncbi:hypothetical protein EDC94DRAFT_689961 [Helicostylum pulchrum]|nr:hypothetical protein EDC94DRAFT_689961 [Helicostylum pulchrum]